MNSKNGKKKLFIALPILAGFIITNPIKANEQKTHIEKESYSVGYEYARTLKLLIEKTEKEHPNLVFDKSKILKGISDSLMGNKPDLDQSQRTTALTNLDSLTNDKADNRIAEENYQKGEIAQNNAKKVPGAMATASGLLYHVITKVKDGKGVNINSKVTLKYKGSLVNGEVFDESESRGSSSRFLVKDLHKGLQEGVLLMKEGERFEFIIKPELAYKETTQPGIPANSTLYYDVELLKVK